MEMNDTRETFISTLKQKVQKVKNLVPELKLTSGTLTAVAVSVILFITSRCFNIPHDVFTLGTSAVANGHVHKLLTYSFFHEDWGQVLLSALVLLPLCSGHEKSVGTVRFLYLLLLLPAWTGLAHVLLELLLFAPEERSHVQGFMPVSLALVGMATVRSRMRRVLLMGISMPTPALPWILLIVTLLIPGTVFLCNIIAILVGEIYGMGWFSLLDMSEARASVLDKKMPFRMLRTLGVLLYVPASEEERRKTLHPPCNPAPGSYPVQAYAPLSSVPSMQGTEPPPQMYEGWQHSTYTQASYAPPSLDHGHSHSHSCGHSHANRFGHSHGHSPGHNHGHSHGQMAAHQISNSWTPGSPYGQAYSSPFSPYLGHPAPILPPGLPENVLDPLLVPSAGHHEASVPPP